MLPETTNLTFEQFKTFLDKTMMTPYSQRILKELHPPETVTEFKATQPEETKPATKPTELAQGKVAAMPPSEVKIAQQAGKCTLLETTPLGAGKHIVCIDDWAATSPAIHTNMLGRGNPCTPNRLAPIQRGKAPLPQKRKRKWSA